MADDSILKKAKITDMTGQKAKKSDVWNKDEKLHTSNYHIICNANKPMKTEEQKRDFIEAIEGMLNSLPQFLKFKGNDGAKFTKRWVKEISTESSIEVGDKYHQLHAHMLIKISHFTKIQLDYGAMKHYLLNSDAEVLHGGFWFKGWLFSNPEAALKDYIMKMNRGRDKLGNVHPEEN